MSLKLFLVLRSSPHEVCFHFAAPGFATSFFRHFEAMLQPDEALRYNLMERLCFIFAPLAFTNSKALEQAPEFFCKALELDDSHSILCDVVDEFHLFAVYHNRHYSEAYLSRHFDNIRDMFSALLGPCWSLLMPSQHRAEHEALQRLLQAMLEELLWLEGAEFQIQFGALEHLGVRHDLKASAVTVLESSCARLNKRMRGSAGPVRHSLLLAGTKLLALFSAPGAADLPPRDVLLVSLLSRALFHRPETNTEVYVTCQDTISEEEPFFSPTEEPLAQNRVRSTSALLENVDWEGVAAAGRTQESEGTEEDGEESEKNPKGLTPSDATSLQSAERSSAVSSCAPSSLEPMVQDVSPTGGGCGEYRHARLLLEAGGGERGAYSLHLVRLSTQLVAVFFQDSPEMPLSMKMIRATELCRRQLLRDGDNLRSLLRATTEITARLAELFGPGNRSCRRLEDLRRRLARPESTPDQPEAPAVSDSLEQLQSCLSEIFGKLFLRSPTSVAQNVTDHIASSARQLQSRLADYMAYLEVKAVRNLAPTSFTSSLPGMVHFVWVDREHQRLIAPTLDPDTLSAEDVERIHFRAEFCRELQHQTRHLEVFCKDAVFQYSFRVLTRSKNQWSTGRAGSLRSDVGDMSRQDGTPTFELFVVHFAHVAREAERRHVEKILKNFMHQNDDINSTLGLLT